MSIGNGKALHALSRRLFSLNSLIRVISICNYILTWLFNLIEVRFFIILLKFRRFQRDIGCIAWRIFPYVSFIICAADS